MKNLFALFESRHTAEELMDHPEAPETELKKALTEIRWVNRRLGGTSTILEGIRQMKPGNDVFDVLDLGTGSADIPRALVDWARDSGKSVQITAVDANPIVVHEARTLSRAYPEINIVEEDALSLPYPDGSYDIVISSMFMHHLTDLDAVALLSTMARLCRVGLLINDLERHPCAWLGIRLLGRLGGKGEMFRHDAPLSVLKGFSMKDLRHLLDQAGLHGYTIQKRHPYRWLVAWNKENEQL